MPVDVDPDRALALGRRRGRLRVEPLDRRRDLRHGPAEARAERAVVRLHPVGDEVRLLADELELLHVQLGADDVAQPLDLLALAAGGDDHRLAQRLSHLHLRGRARRAAQLDRAQRGLDAGLELGVAPVRLGRREVGEMDRFARGAQVACGSRRSRTG